MERKKKKRRWPIILFMGILVIWTMKRIGKKKKEQKYTISERHEYYKFLG